MLQYLKVFAVVIALTCLATGLRLWLLGPNNDELVWLTFYPVVIVSGLYAGMTAGLLATFAACITAGLLWPLLFNHVLIQSNTAIVELMVFVFICSVICFLIAVLNRYRQELKTLKGKYRKLAEREQFISSIIDCMPNMMGYWGSDLRCRFANSAFSKWFHQKPEDILGMSFKALIGERLFKINEPYISEVLAGKPQRFERTLKKTDGSTGTVLGHYIPDFDVDGTVKGFAIQASDVTELKQAEAELKMAAHVFDNTLDGVSIADINGLTLSVNPAFEQITGYAAAEVIGQDSSIFKTNSNPPALYFQIREEIATKGRFQSDIWARRKDGGLFLARLTTSLVLDDGGVPIRYVSIFSDITDVKRKDKHLKNLAFYDGLTQLPNRTLMMERLEQKIIYTKRQPSPLALMFIDLDDFKFVNDHFGHNTGDDLLKIIAKRLLDLVRESDTIARIGGDEFIFILNNPKTKNEIIEVSQRILKSINKPIEISGNAVEIGMSIGIAIYPADGITADQLINNADTAMYSAKKLGKNNVCFFSDLQN